MVEIGEAVGVIAAQSIGEPGTQLTMRTFHTGGVATGGADITQGLPRVEELFEARVPKGKAVIGEIDGEVEVIRGDTKSLKVKIFSRDVFDFTYAVPPRHSVTVEDGQPVSEGTELIRGFDENGSEISIRSKYAGLVRVGKSEITVRTTDEEAREYAVPASSELVVRDGDHIQAGDRITKGSISPQELLLVRGRDDVQNYLVHEVQSVYRNQGVDINDKHIEVIVRQMMRKVRVDASGDTDLLPGEIVSQFEFEEANAKALSEGGEPAIAQTVLLGPDQGRAQHRLMALGGVVPGDHPGAHRGCHLRQGRPPPRPQGERHHRQADPRRDRPRLLPEAAGGGGPPLRGGRRRRHR